MPDRRQAIGRQAEAAAAAYLEERGLTVVTRNARFDAGEIDLVCREGSVWVFVEVKSRGSHWGESAATAVTREKRERLARLAQLYLKWKGLGHARCRFDVIAVALAPDGNVREIRHLRGAFDGEAW
jgi:putative endonuclease